MEVLARLRSAHNYTQEEISDALDIQRASYSQIENGKRKLSFVEFKKLCGFYRVAPSEMVDIIEFGEFIMKPKAVKLPDGVSIEDYKYYENL